MWTTTTPEFELPERSEGGRPWGELEQVVSVAGEFVGFGQSSAGFITWTTTDGSYWTIRGIDDTFGDSWPRIVDVRGSRVLATHREDNAETLHISDDGGATWRMVPSPPNPDEQLFLYSAVLGPDGSLVTTRGSVRPTILHERVIWRTQDLATWSSAPADETVCPSLLRSDSTVWLIDCEAAPSYSVDSGATFTPVTEEASNDAIGAVFDESVVLTTATTPTDQPAPEQASRLNRIALDGTWSQLDDTHTGLWGDGPVSLSVALRIDGNTVIARMGGTRFADPHYCFSDPLGCQHDMSQWLVTADGGDTWTPVDIPAPDGPQSSIAITEDGSILQWWRSDEGEVVTYWPGPMLPPALEAAAPYDQPDQPVPFFQPGGALREDMEYRVALAMVCGGWLEAEEQWVVVDPAALDRPSVIRRPARDDGSATVFGRIERTGEATAEFWIEEADWRVDLVPRDAADHCARD